MRLTAVYEPVENGWTQARVEEIPAVITAGSTLDEAKALLLDALREYFLALGERRDTLVAPEESQKESVEIILSA
jgi:predicted RNase H-like HicB family nuclease